MFTFLILASTATNFAVKQIPRTTNIGNETSSLIAEDSLVVNRGEKYLPPSSMACLIGIIVASLQITWTAWLSLSEYFRYGVCLKSDYSKGDFDENKINVDQGGCTFKGIRCGALFLAFLNGALLMLALQLILYA